MILLKYYGMFLLAPAVYFLIKNWKEVLQHLLSLRLFIAGGVFLAILLWATLGVEMPGYGSDLPPV